MRKYFAETLVIEFNDFFSKKRKRYFSNTYPKGVPTGKVDINVPFRSVNILMLSRFLGFNFFPLLCIFYRILIFKPLVSGIH